MNKLNPPIKNHLVAGLLLALWLFIFAFIIKPIDDATINLKSWFLISIGFSGLASVCYAMLAFFKKRFTIESKNGIDFIR